MNWLRTIAFMVLFYSGSVPIVLTVPISGLFGRKAVIAHAMVWARFHRWVTRLTLGIQGRIEGHIPDYPVLYAAKHQAMYETIDLPLMIGPPVIVMKRELQRIPVWGWATRRYGSIAVDRAGSGATMRQMMREAKLALEERRPVLIFPEGTRVAPGERPPLKAGFAGLYRMLGLPVVPVAIDSGRVWPKHGAKHPGVITFRFGEPIPPGLPRAEIEARVHTAMNALDDATA